MHDLPNPQAPQEITESPIFAAQGLSFCYPNGTRALQEIDLRIGAGERIALVGHNGSGKTTLARQLCGLNLPSAGRLEFRGAALLGAHLEKSRLSIGLLFQDPDDQLFASRLIDDVTFGPRHQGCSAEQAEVLAVQALKQVGLAELAGKAPHRLSLGQKKRAALAGLLAMDPEVLILDEPTANLDPQQEELFLQLLRDFSGTLICISHDLLFLYALCQRAVVLEQGQIHHDFSMARLVSQREALHGHGLDFSFRFVSTPHVAATPASETSEPCPHEDRLPETQLPALFELKDVHFSYPDGSQALRGLDLRVSQGERLAIVGENGAGKSTLLAGLLGILPLRGDYRYAGAHLKRRQRKELWRQIGMVFQDCSDQLFCPSVYEELAFSLEQAGRSPEEIRSRVSEMLALVRLEGFEQRVPLHLSGGERKRLALACALVMEPQLLILDEPTAGLDPQGEELLLEILRELNCALLLVSHDIFFVGELTRRTLVMHQGRVVQDMETAEFLQDASLANINGLNFSYRQRSSVAIRRLQHLHEHSHAHRHLHDHVHRHGDLIHGHPHEHEHEHPHQFVHEHADGDKSHQHPPRQFHEHEHPEHGEELHDHPH